jgi:hypothetical protein
MHTITFNIHGLKATAKLSNLQYFVMMFYMGQMSEEVASRYIGRPVQDYEELGKRLMQIVDCEYTVKVG